MGWGVGRGSLGGLGLWVVWQGNGRGFKLKFIMSWRWGLAVCKEVQWVVSEVKGRLDGSGLVPVEVDS